MTNNIFDAILTHSTTKKKTVKQQKVFDTAIRLFAEKGYANTSTAEIARHAGVSEGIIFKHYGTKDRLLLSVILPFVNELFPQMAQEMINKASQKHFTSFEQLLRFLMKDRIDFITENKEVFQVLVKEFLYKDELREELLSYSFPKISPIYKDVIEEFKECGELINLPTERIIKILLTFFGGFFVSRFLFINNYSITEEEIDDAIQFIMNGLKKTHNGV